MNQSNIIDIKWKNNTKRNLGVIFSFRAYYLSKFIKTLELFTLFIMKDMEFFDRILV